MAQRLARQARMVQQRQASRQSGLANSARGDLGPRTGATNRPPRRSRAPAPPRTPAPPSPPARQSPPPSPDRAARTPTPAPAPAPAPDTSGLEEAEEARRKAEEEAAAAEAARQRQIEELTESIQEQPLDPSLVEQFAARERAAKRSFQEAEVAAQRGRQQATLDFEQFLRQLDERVGSARGALRGEAAARNLAFQPAFVGAGMRDIRDETAIAQAEAQQQRSQFLSGIERQVQQAERAREEEISSVARERTRAEADHRAHIEAQIEALRG